jgi:hypothetical protein
MTRLDRRSLLLAATLVVAQQPMPEWLSYAFGPSAAQDPDSPEVALAKLSTWRRGQLREVAATARTLGRPLLVLLVPDGQPSHAVGQWYGAFFGYARPEAMFDVSLCTVVCASADEVKVELGTKDANVAPPKQAVAMLLIDLPADPKAAPTKVTRIEPELERTFPREGAPPRDERAAFDRAERAWRESGLRRLANALHEGLAQHGVDSAPQAAVVARSLTEPEQREVQAWLRDGGHIDIAMLLRIAPLLQQQVADLPKARRIARYEELGNMLRTARIHQRVPGSVWGDAFCPPCGMGRVAPLCGRFLDFYTQPAEAK